MASEAVEASFTWHDSGWHMVFCGWEAIKNHFFKDYEEVIYEDWIINWLITLIKFIRIDLNFTDFLSFLFSDMKLSTRLSLEITVLEDPQKMSHFEFWS